MVIKTRIEEIPLPRNGGAIVLLSSKEIQLEMKSPTPPPTLTYGKSNIKKNSRQRLLTKASSNQSHVSCTQSIFYCVYLCAHLIDVSLQ